MWSLESWKNLILMMNYEIFVNLTRTEKENDLLRVEFQKITSPSCSFEGSRGNDNFKIALFLLTRYAGFTDILCNIGFSYHI